MSEKGSENTWHVKLNMCCFDGFQSYRGNEIKLLEKKVMNIGVDECQSTKEDANIRLDGWYQNEKRTECGECESAFQKQE